MYIDKHYAVNLFDLTAAIGNDPLHPIKILLNPDEILSREVVKCERKRVDGMALRVRANVEKDRWDTIVTIIRKGVGRLEGIPKHKLRIYESKTGKGGWGRI